MKSFIKILLLGSLFPAAGNAGLGDVLSSWPAPQNIVANGIAFEGDYIWLKHGTCEYGRVFKCTKSGSVVNEIGFPFHAMEISYGLAFDGTYLWTIYHQPVATRYDCYVRYTTAGSVVKFFTLTRWPWYRRSISLSWDGQYLWTDEWRESKAYGGKYSTGGSLLGTFNLPASWGSDAGYYNDQLWYGGPQPWDTIYGGVIGGALVGSFAAPGGSCYAVGFDGEYLWTADKNTPQYIYKVDIDVVDVEPGSFGKIKGIYR
jgi:hypothetical protein